MRENIVMVVPLISILLTGIIAITCPSDNSLKVIGEISLASISGFFGYCCQDRTSKA